MKTSELLKILKKNGVVFIRHGGSHDIYYSSKTGLEMSVPRHKGEVKTGTAHDILKKAGIK